MNKIIIPRIGTIDERSLADFIRRLDDINSAWECELSEEEFAKLHTHTLHEIRSFLCQIEHTESRCYLRPKHHMTDEDGLAQFAQNTFYKKHR